MPEKHPIQPEEAAADNGENLASSPDHHLAPVNQSPEFVPQNENHPLNDPVQTPTKIQATTVDQGPDEEKVETSVDAEVTSVEKTDEPAQKHDEGTDQKTDQTDQSINSTNPSAPVELEKIDSNDSKGSTDEQKPPSVKKKRLTLQERLALAAKGNKKSAKSSSTVSPPPATPPPEPKEVKEEPKQENTDSERLAAENLELKQEIKRLQLRTAPTSLEKERKEYASKLAAKDETIQQLMKEGEALSIKELKLNDTIKALKITNGELEELLKNYSVKNEESLLKISELDDFLKTHKFKSVQQLMDSYFALTQKLAESQTKFDREKDMNWELKYKEQQSLYDEEAREKKTLIKELNENKIQLDMFKSQAALDVESKENAISNLKRDIASLKDEYSQEVARLENKVEFFRMQNESFVSDNREAQKSDTAVIEYEEFAKLSQAHHNLQQQYVSLQENWKLIESNLLAKVDSLSLTVESLKKSKVKLTADLRRLQNENSEQAEQIDQYSDIETKYSNEISELKFQIEVKDQEIRQSQEKFDKFKQIYNTDRQDLETKVKKLLESLEKYKSEVNGDGFDKKLLDAGLHINIDPPPRLLIRSSSQSTIDSPTQTFPSNMWPEIRLGESSTTPAIHKDFSGVFMNASHNNSSSSLHGNENYEDSFSFHSRNANNSFNNHGSIAALASGGNSNIQLINKMSSNIRRLEIELNTLREENTTLSSEKEQAQQEILNNIKLESDVEDLKQKISILQQEIDQKSIKEQTMLEVIGEKSEQVEELRADVMDLKDLCRQQVQQMIELQETS